MPHAERFSQPGKQNKTTALLYHAEFSFLELLRKTLCLTSQYLQITLTFLIKPHKIVILEPILLTGCSFW